MMMNESGNLSQIRFLNGSDKNCTSKGGQFHTLTEQGNAQPVPANLQIMVEYAREILNNFVRCQTRQTEIEK